MNLSDALSVLGMRKSAASNVKDDGGESGGEENNEDNTCESRCRLPAAVAWKLGVLLLLSWIGAQETLNLGRLSDLEKTLNFTLASLTK